MVDYVRHWNEQTEIPARQWPEDQPRVSEVAYAGNTFTLHCHYVCTTVFSWYGTGLGQVSGPWVSVEGRDAWTGEPAFWQTQVKQMMAANIDVLQVELFSDYGRGSGTLGFGDSGYGNGWPPWL